MIASRLIKEEILPLKMTDTFREAFSRMSEYKVSHFPVVEEGKLLGVVSEIDVENHENPDDRLSNDIIHFDNLHVNEFQYIIDVLKLSSNRKLSLIPVIDEKATYIGSITQNDIVVFFADSMSVNNPGGVIILEVSDADYQLTEIASIVESNNAKILSTYILSGKDSTIFEVIIKISKLDLNAILQTFERFKYNVVASFGQDKYYSDLKDNYDSLIKYLNI